MLRNLIILQLSITTCVFGDSIILNNDCKRTSEECVIQLETIKGEPGRDCAIFATVDRICSLDGANQTEVVIPPTNPIPSITDTEEGTVVTWHGTKDSKQGEETVHLTAGSVWNRPPASRVTRRRRDAERGTIVSCRCKPVQRTKRDSALSMLGKLNVNAVDMTSAPITRLLDTKKKTDGCDSGYRNTGNGINKTSAEIIRSVPSGSVHNCAMLCGNEFVKSCVTFAFTTSADPTHDDCLLLSALPSSEKNKKSDFNIYEKC